MHVVIYIGGQDRSVYVCGTQQKQKTGGVPEVSSEEGTDVRC